MREFQQSGIYLVCRTIFTVIFCLTANSVYAGAWTQNEGKGLLITNLSYYSTSRFFDNSGNKQSFKNYNKYELNPYLEYGLRNDVTIGANILAIRASQYSSNLGIGDSEFFIRNKIWQKDGVVFSVEPMLKLPSLENRNKQPQIGNKHFDTGLTFSGGYAFKAWQLDHFVNFDASYRHRFGTPNDQLKFTATTSFAISQKYTLLTQIFTTTRIASNSQLSFTQSSSDDYDLAKLQISGVYKLDEKLSLQISAFNNISGRNVGSGNGTVFAINRIF